MREINQIVLHCSAARVLGQRVEMVRQWHKSQGWSDVGYHFFIGFDGLAEAGRPLEQVGAHAEGHNKNSIGICLAGLEKNDFTQRQFESLKVLLTLLKLSFPDARLVGHNELTNKKTCPVFDVGPWKELWAALPSSKPGVAVTVSAGGEVAGPAPKG